MAYQVESRSLGFTLVELVIVIILVSTLSIVTIGLFTSRSAFSPLLATQQLASATLIAQQAALAGNPASSLLVEQTSDEFRFTVGPATPFARTFQLDRAGASLAITGGLPLTIAFDDHGAPSAGANVNFSFSGDSNFQACLSSRGAIYSGICQ